MSPCQALQKAYVHLQRVTEAFRVECTAVRQSGDLTEARRLKRKVEQARNTVMEKWCLLNFGDQARYFSLEIGGQTEKQLEQALEQPGFTIFDDALSIIRSKDFTTMKHIEQQHLVCLTIDALFDDGFHHTTDEIYTKAKDFGLELCAAEAGPHLCLTYTDQPFGKSFLIAMKQITDSDGILPSIFHVERDGYDSCLYCNWAQPDHVWDPGCKFVFRLRK